jgi:hypothetical protein
VVVDDMVMDVLATEQQGGNLKDEQLFLAGRGA